MISTAVFCDRLATVPGATAPAMNFLHDDAFYKHEAVALDASTINHGSTERKILGPGTGPRLAPSRSRKPIQLRIRPVKWLWEGRTPLGAVTLVGGKKELENPSRSIRSVPTLRAADCRAPIKAARNRSSSPQLKIVGPIPSSRDSWRLTRALKTIITATSSRPRPLQRQCLATRPPRTRARHRRCQGGARGAGPAAVTTSMPRSIRIKMRKFEPRWNR